MHFICRTLLNYKITILTTIIVLTLSLMGSSNVPKTSFLDFHGIDKIVHFGMYFTLSFVLFLEKNKFRKDTQTGSKKKRYIQPIIFLVILGGLVEILQPILSNRNCCFYDFIANTLGVLSGYAAYILVFKKLKS